MLRKIDHFVLTAKNPEATAAFYGALGFTAHDEGSHYELFAGDFKINVHFWGRELSPRAARVQTGSADICFELSGSMEDCLRTLAAAGLPVELGPVTRHGTRGEMTSVYLRDPDENLVELCTYA